MKLMELGLRWAHQVFEERMEYYLEDEDADPEEMNDCKADFARMFKDIQAAIDSGGKEVQIENCDSTDRRDG